MRKEVWHIRVRETMFYLPQKNHRWTKILLFFLYRKTVINYVIFGVGAVNHFRVKVSGSSYAINRICLIGILCVSQHLFKFENYKNIYGFTNLVAQRKFQLKRLSWRFYLHSQNNHSKCCKNIDFIFFEQLRM